MARTKVARTRTKRIGTKRMRRTSMKNGDKKKLGRRTSRRSSRRSKRSLRRARRSMRMRGGGDGEKLTIKGLLQELNVPTGRYYEKGDLDFTIDTYKRDSDYKANIANLLTLIQKSDLDQLPFDLNEELKEDLRNRKEKM